jgi:uncharacterized membrane protein YeiH
VLYYLGLLGIIAFAVTGVIAAGKKDMDLFSIVLLGVATALGGGTLRDLILDTHPIFWVADLTYLWVSVVAAIGTFFCVRLVSRLLKLFIYLDAFGMALFTILSMEKLLELGYGNTIALLMGLITGISGGMLRDILTGRMPLVLGREFYATPALVGAIAFGILNAYFPNHSYNWFYGVSVIVVLRILAVHWGLYYPSWLTYEGKDIK